MRKAEMEEANERVKIPGRTLNNLRYADNTTLMAGKKADLTKLIRRLKRKSENAGLYFNIKKTKIITPANWDSFEIDGEEIEVVTSFTFLGSEVEKEPLHTYTANFAPSSNLQEILSAYKLNSNDPPFAHLFVLFEPISHIYTTQTSYFIPK